ncbi:hypothetical protein BJV78DRAFT_819385 [Lactifluus subvellereus]|nr:hypothetical protein BJV78DRAFT_819385 [Lactifluus subvellereus]
MALGSVPVHISYCILLLSSRDACMLSGIWNSRFLALRPSSEVSIASDFLVLAWFFGGVSLHFSGLLGVRSICLLCYLLPCVYCFIELCSVICILRSRPCMIAYQ